MISIAALSFIAAVVLCGMLVWISWIDVKYGMLPDLLTLPLMWAGLLINRHVIFTPLGDAVLGAAAGYCILWIANQAYRLRSGQNGMGYGDFKLMAALGAWLGINAVPWILIGACSAGTIVMYILHLRGSKKTNHAFGPFLSAAGVVMLVRTFSS
ncbi:MAG: hypothetical protein CML16_15645 [Pusillimonas sp.]|nr:hypothetical protein [Pusillimonas sp.]MBC42504.1 hypothetical protein [Pusillimonas sp.]HCP78293.1 prepilin peptidase [Pusillimonas sp.]|tara:strand:+ start:12584 stop:13048 length:465 start_codon:yes stop_codon:yes gene_type:complete